MADEAKSLSDTWIATYTQSNAEVIVALQKFKLGSPEAQNELADLIAENKVIQEQFIETFRMEGIVDKSYHQNKADLIN